MSTGAEKFSLDLPCKMLIYKADDLSLLRHGSNEAPRRVLEFFSFVHGELLT